MIFMDFLLTTTWLPYLYSFPFELIFSSVHNIAFFFLLQFSRHLFYVVYKAFLLLIEDELLLLTSIFYLRIYSQGRTNTHKTITIHIQCSHKSGNHTIFSLLHRSVLSLELIFFPLIFNYHQTYVIESSRALNDERKKVSSVTSTAICHTVALVQFSDGGLVISKKH